MITETTTAAAASASDGEIEGAIDAIAAAIRTAVLRSVSAQTCCNENNVRNDYVEKLRRSVI
jgi:hypothetical protein